MATLGSNHVLLVVILIVGAITVKNVHAGSIFSKPKPPPPEYDPPPMDAPPPLPDRVKKGIQDMFDFVKYCGIYMNRFSPRFHRPNEKCCVHARKVNLKYFCAIFFVQETEAIFSPRKVAIIAKDCGKPFPRFTMCGSHFVWRNQSALAPESVTPSKF